MQAAPLAPTSDEGSIAARLRRLARAYADGLLNEEEYERERTAMERLRQNAQPQQPTARYDHQAAVQLLSNLPDLLEQASGPECKAIVHTLFSHVHVREAALVSVTPRADIEPLIRGIAKWVGGVADGLQLHRPHTKEPLIIRPARRLQYILQPATKAGLGEITALPVPTLRAPIPLGARSFDKLDGP